MDELHLNLGSLDVIITDRNHPTTIISSEHEEILVLDPRDRGGAQRNKWACPSPQNAGWQRQSEGQPCTPHFWLSY